MLYSKAYMCVAKNFWELLKFKENYARHTGRMGFLAMKIMLSGKHFSGI